MNIEVGKIYFYNNGAVKVLEIKSDKFVLVEGDNSLHTELNGSDFCTACQSVMADGSHPRHECEDAQNVIDNVLDDASEKYIFHVESKHLQEKPYEYKKWEKITGEIKNLQKTLVEKQGLLENLAKNEDDKKQVLDWLDKNIKEKRGELDLIIEKTPRAIKKIILLEDIPEIKLRNSNMSIPTAKVIYLIKRSQKLGILESGGVDNWEWYGECFSDHEKQNKYDDYDDYMNNRALEILSTYRKK